MQVSDRMIDSLAMRPVGIVRFGEVAAESNMSLQMVTASGTVSFETPQMPAKKRKADCYLHTIATYDL